ncbi:CTP:phosphocholine cytidylyltransferase [Ruminococcaceae bacterium YRB3002]|nr:CTP:phosphocholine cytidylyltransferase [Ruminococcaceae bacterium YRB3002]
MHHAVRAIIMAAGKGERMRPLTNTTPKPMISVLGTRMIDTVIDALHANGIEDIVIVTGYLGDRFRELTVKYPGLRFVDNPVYDTCNNISSLYAAREYLDCDVMIMDGDQVIRNTDILAPGFDRSGYNATRVTKETDEWVMTVEDGVVTGCSRTGGTDGWQLYSISRWSREDAEVLRNLLEEEFIINRRHNVYWDDIPMFLHPDKFELGIREMNEGDMTEIDSYDELIKTDPSYIGHKA